MVNLKNIKKLLKCFFNSLLSQLFVFVTNEILNIISPKYYVKFHLQDVMRSPITNWLISSADIKPTASFQRLQYFIKAAESWGKWLAISPRKSVCFISLRHY